MNHQTSTIPQVTYQSPQAHTQPMTKSPFGDSSFDVLVFSPRDDLIACLNKAIDFLIAVASSRNLTDYRSDNHPSQCCFPALMDLRYPLSPDACQDCYTPLSIRDFGCSKHMTGNRSQLMNFISKFLGTVRFRNDQIARIVGYDDYQLGNVIISMVYYVEGLGHNLFSVGQFCDEDLEVAFWKNTCFIRNLEGVDLLSGSRDINLYTISLGDMLKSSPICILSKASKTKSWLWHRRLSHLNFGTLNKLAKDDLARVIPRLKFQKDHLCSACALGKIKKILS
ncbi:retrovirus-related pol polyprotein from transposon TNT 1-94 [Tanacetum coccineum]